MNSMPKKMIIAIDGPSGAGKSTLSRLLSQRLNYVNIDTGAMYRAVTLAIHRAGVDLKDSAAITKLCRRLDIHFDRSKNGIDGETVWLGSEDVSGVIRTPEMSLLTSKAAACAEVRSCLLDLQREMGVDGGVVLEGRDIGSVVFPDAQVKFYLCASAQARGRRRYEELKLNGVDVSLEQTIVEVQQRDAADSDRVHAPLMQAADAVVIDATSLSIEQVLDKMLMVVDERLNSCDMA